MNSQNLLNYNNKLYVSNEASVREELLKRYHNNLLARHFGIAKITELISRKYFWESIKTDIKKYVNICDVCQRVKVKRYRFYNELRALFILKGPWKEITMNFITNLLLSKYKHCVYDAILIVMNRYIKIIVYISIIKKINAIELKKLLMRKVFLKFGAFEDIITNREFVFTSAFWSKICYQI